ncbi:MAG: carbon-phosphorus lyase complex subunit PhnI [Dehalococcoidia bacterium]|nr:carbon-phosphorus lyase complex subunit PhnI [Dehalococcoidia bacterium]
MGYSSVRGGLDAIEHAERLIHNQVTEGGDILEVSQVADHLQLITDQVMGEGGVYDVELGALAVKQAEGDPIEAAFLLRAYRTTLPRVGYSLASSGRELRITRRISSAFRDIPGGQVLGRTRDYTQRLMDFSLLDGGEPMPLGPIAQADAPEDDEFPLVIDVLRAQELMPAAPERPADIEPFDVTREPLRFPATRSARLQGLARAETGALLSLAYAGMRGYGGDHGYIAELRQGDLPVKISHPVTGRAVRIGWVSVTECYQIVGGQASTAKDRPDYTMGYGMVIGRNERKAISMSIIDASLKKEVKSGNVIEDEEYVLYHCDAIESMGFVEHLKLPHYVDFQASLARTSKVRELVKAARTNV